MKMLPVSLSLVAAIGLGFTIVSFSANASSEAGSDPISVTHSADEEEATCKEACKTTMNKCLKDCGGDKKCKKACMKQGQECGNECS